ncbi:SIP domain-containing protein [Microbacterium soli]|uniref:SIP-like Rossmann fold domain-containing protein n=1 Tax=Microbacterium soli TaxID=446075 RepID=A0ABP7MMV9_9MICO
MSTLETFVGTRAARRASQRRQVQHLITADERSLVEVEVLLAALPLCTAGRVFIEVPSAEDIGTVVAPPRMTVTWLPRARRGGGRRAMGEALTRAAAAWADEMLCDGSDAVAGTEVTLLGGYLSTADIIEHLTESCGVDPIAIHAPERYGLPVR